MPVNIAEMMKAEEARLLQKVDPAIRETFLSKRDGIRNLAPSREMVSFSDVSGFDERILLMKIELTLYRY